MFQKTVRSISRMASEFVRLEQGEIEALGDQQTTHEFTEMARIAEAFNKILAELKTNERARKFGSVPVTCELDGPRSPHLATFGHLE